MNVIFSSCTHITWNSNQSTFALFASIFLVSGICLNTYERWISNPKGHIARSCWRSYRVGILMNSRVK